MKLLNSNMHETHSVFIISAIETLALQKYNSMSADEKRGLVSKYICWRWDQGQPSADSLQYGIQQLH